jgi:hypothetical protein
MTAQGSPTTPKAATATDSKAASATAKANAQLAAEKDTPTYKIVKTNAAGGRSAVVALQVLCEGRTRQVFQVTLWADSEDCLNKVRDIVSEGQSLLLAGSTEEDVKLAVKEMRAAVRAFLVVASSSHSLLSSYV